jgi:hypothetical protein
LFGIGRKDREGRQVRVEHRGKHLRASRTGGVSARAQGKLGPVTATGNTRHGIRLKEARLASGARVALQNGRVRLIGRWNAGLLGLNLSKSGGSIYAKSGLGSFNILKPQYSSMKLAGVQIRGRKAAGVQAAIYVVMAVIWFAIAVITLLVGAVWLVILALLLVWDLLSGFLRGLISPRA